MVYNIRPFIRTIARRTAHSFVIPSLSVVDVALLAVALTAFLTDRIGVAGYLASICAYMIFGIWVQPAIAERLK